MKFTLFRRNTKARELRKKKVDDFMAKKNGQRTALDEVKEEEAPVAEETDEEDHSPNNSTVEEEEEREAVEPEPVDQEEIPPEPRMETTSNTGLLCGCL